MNSGHGMTIKLPVCHLPRSLILGLKPISSAEGAVVDLHKLRGTTKASRLISTYQYAFFN